MNDIETKEFKKTEKRWNVYMHIVPKEISGYGHDKYYIGII